MFSQAEDCDQRAAGGEVKAARHKRHRFTSCYTRGDVELLADG
jgi:hypothetical protein